MSVVASIRDGKEMGYLLTLIKPLASYHREAF